jgi:aminoglycoside phosphotransferase (APT) family kinase protein
LPAYLSHTSSRLKEQTMAVAPGLSTEQAIAAMRLKYPAEEYVQHALDRKLRLRAGGAYTAQSVEKIGARLHAFLARRISTPFRISDLKPLTGGISKEQFSFVLDREQAGISHRERLVLRTQPTQSAAETHRLREFQLMGALQGVVPIPEPRWIDAEGEEFENPAIICSFVEGVSKPSDGLTDVRIGYGQYRETLAPQFVEMLARTHTFDVHAADLSSFELPPTGSPEGVITLINWWARVWEEDSVEPEPLATLTERWLRDNAPPIDRVSIVHGDYRSSNFLFSMATGEITAVLDWELASLGDRHLDLAYVLQPLFAETAPDGRKLICGLMTREEFLTEYARRSGLRVDQDRLDYYEILVRWRNMATTIAGGARCVIEQKTHQDVSFAWFVPLVGPTIMSSMREAIQPRFPA